MHRLPSLLLVACALSSSIHADDDSEAVVPEEVVQAVSNLNPAEGEDAEEPPEVDLDALYSTGKALFDTYAPDEIKEEYAFPEKDEWHMFIQRLQGALASDSFEDLLAMEPDVRTSIEALRALPDYAAYADWLDERLDFIQAAKGVQVSPLPQPTPKPSPSPLPVPPSEPGPFAPKPAPTVEPTPAPGPLPQPKVSDADVPYLDVWKERIRNRPKPRRADELMPTLKDIFTAEGVPAVLVWLAEVESSFNPQARSPAGAYGLFQLMPATAKALGLSTFPFDERKHPEKSAQAAAKLLSKLYARYQSWPLALAAYNAGEGKVARALKKTDGSTFADIAHSLPVETRMYVPKVLATISLREGTSLSQFGLSSGSDTPLVVFTP